MSLRGELFVGLHPRQRQVLTLVAAGGGNKGIARQLGVSTATTRVSTCGPSWSNSTRPVVPRPWRWRCGPD